MSLLVNVIYPSICSSVVPPRVSGRIPKSGDNLERGLTSNGILCCSCAARLEELLN